MTRREFMTMTTTGLAGGVVAATCRSGGSGGGSVRSVSRLPALFVSHGSPMVALESDEYDQALALFATQAPRPSAIVVVSAHWEAPAPIRVTAVERPETIHDFSGFPDALYRLRYDAPGAPALAAEIVERLGTAGIPAGIDAARGLDHGAWVPLRILYPGADVPVVGVSLAFGRSPEELLRLGRALAPLRERGALLFGSGGVVHNLRLVRFADKRAPVDDWARRFDDWVAERLGTMDVGGLAAYRERAPESRLAVPTTEHFDPLFVVLGSAAAAERANDVYTGFHHGSLSMRSFSVSAPSGAS